MLDKAYQAVRERTPDLGYTFLVRHKANSSLLLPNRYLCRKLQPKKFFQIDSPQHANKLYFEKELKLNECLRLVLADQVTA